MASTNVIRRVALNASRSSRSFHASARSFIQVGDKLPNLDVLVENSPGNKVNLSEAIKGKALIIGVPAAFSKLLLLVYSARALTRPIRISSRKWECWLRTDLQVPHARILTFQATSTTRTWRALEMFSWLLSTIHSC